MMKPKDILQIWSLLLTCTLGAFLLSGCGGGSDEDGKSSSNGGDFPPYDNTEEVEAYYKENSDFFVFATPEDLPQDLEWQDGLEFADIGSPDAKKGGTWHQYEPDFPRTLRQIGPDANGSFRFWQTDLLVTYARRHPNEEAPDAYIPGIAKEWALDPENATVYCKLDPDARWSDGEPITTEDVAFDYYYHRTSYNTAPWYQDFYTSYFSKVTIYDDLTFSITTSSKKPDYHQYVLLNSPTPRHFYKEYGPDYVQRYQWRFQPTTGAYVIKDEDIDKGKSIALTRVEDWWAKDKKYYRNLYNPDRIEFSVIRDPNKAFEAFLAGNLDSSGLSLAKYWYEQLPDDDPKVQNGYIKKVIFKNKIPQGGFNFWINTSMPYLDDVNVRKGIAHSLDWDLVLEQVFRGMWARMQASGIGYGEADHPTLKSREFDPKKAKELFAKAGFTEMGADGILRNKEGDRLSFTVTTGYKTLSDHLGVLKQQARQAGLELDLDILEGTSAWKKTQEKKHQIAFSGFSFSPNELYPGYWQTYHSDNAYKEDGSIKTQTNNLVQINNDTLDELIDKYRFSESHEEKVRLAHQIEEFLYDQAVHAYGFYRPSYRVGHWRWMKFPEDFNVMRSEYYFSWMVHWIDEEARAETKAAMKSGKTFPAPDKGYVVYPKGSEE